MVTKPLYPVADINGHSRSVNFRIPKLTYDQLSELFEEISRKFPGEYSNFSDCMRYGMVLLVQSMTMKLGSTDAPSYTQQANILRRMNDLLSFEMTIKDDLAKMRDNIQAYERRYGQPRARELVQNQVNVISGITDPHIKNDCLEFLEREFPLYMDTL